MKLTIHIVLTFVGFLFANAAFAAEVLDIGVQMKSGQTQVVVTHNSSGTPKIFTINGDKPRVVIDIPQTDLDNALQDTHALDGTGGVLKVRYSKRGQDGVRIVADLERGAAYISSTNENGQLVIIIRSDELPLRKFKGAPFPRLKPNVAPQRQPATDDNPMMITASVTKPVKAEYKRQTVSGIPVPILKPKHKTVRFRKPVIVIDPGHGGHDPGAIGTAKVKEETVTLKAALELRRQLLATGKYEVVLTRSTDTYIAHDKRILIARKAGADLFISLHADSLSRPATRGASVYTLASRAEGRSRRITNSQNWISGVDLAEQSAPVGDILVDLAQRKTLTKSGEFAEILLPELQKKTTLLGNSHRKAGYYVLLAPDVPAVLLEMGFLSNVKDEKLLNSAAHRKKLMGSVTSAINTYFNAQSPLQAAR